MTRVLVLVLLSSLPAAMTPAAAEVFVSGDLPRRGDRPFESVEGVDSHYGVHETADGARLRTIVTVPSGAAGPLPAIYFTQWVSCGSIEIGGSVSSRILEALARDSGRALVRVERAGTGDSTGPACSELDYDTELAHYRSAYLALGDSPLVDDGDVVVYGSSLGSTTAPLLAAALLEQGVGITGLMVQGGGALTYLERMIRFDRRYLERKADATPGAIHEEMQDRVRFQLAYLADRRHPDEVAKDSPAMAEVRQDILGMGAEDHYGRPFAWHQQAARHDFLAAWLTVARPTLVIYGEFDQYESRHGHRLIAEALNRAQPGLADYVELPHTGHSNRIYPDVLAAYQGRDGVAAPMVISRVMLDWLARRVPVAAAD